MERFQTPERISLSQLLRKYGATDMRDLHLRVYMADDQNRMKNHTWDYQGQSMINDIYIDCQKIDAHEISEDDRVWLYETLWMWNHHAISTAIWRHKDLDAARKYTEVALKYQYPNHPNHITRLFGLLLENREIEAVEWIESIPDAAEKETALSILESYRGGWNPMN